MLPQILKVTEFHRNFNFPVGKRVEDEGVSDERQAGLLRSTESQLASLSERLYTYAKAKHSEGDARLWRIYLMVEELCEAVRAMDQQEETDLADALGDLLYVVMGTAVVYDIPLKEVFEEIHESNMTKEINTDGGYKDTSGYKGTQYKAPDIAGAIQRGRHKRTSDGRSK